MSTTPTGAGTIWQRLRHGARRLCARADWADYAGADWPERIMAAQVTDDFHAKQGRSTGRWVLHAGESTLAVYLKRHYRLSWSERILATLWPGGDWSPALRERRNLEWARAHGVPVPRVAAAGEFPGPALALQSFLAVEELTGMLALHQAVPLAARQLDAATFQRWKTGLGAEMARLARLLHDRRRFHKDLYLCHYYVPRADTWAIPTSWVGRVHLIDLHRLTHHPILWPVWLVKDLGQLLYSSDVEGVGPRDRWRFWRAYLGPIRNTGRARLLLRFVLLKGGRYRDHNTKKKELLRAGR